METQRKPQAPLPPNGTRKRPIPPCMCEVPYPVHCDCANRTRQGFMLEIANHFGDWIQVGLSYGYSLSQAKALAREEAIDVGAEFIRITTRLADGRKLVIR